MKCWCWYTICLGCACVIQQWLCNSDTCCTHLYKCTKFFLYIGSKRCWRNGSDNDGDGHFWRFTPVEGKLPTNCASLQQKLILLSLLQRIQWLVRCVSLYHISIRVSLYIRTSITYRLLVVHTLLIQYFSVDRASKLWNLTYYISDLGCAPGIYHLAAIIMCSDKELIKIDWMLIYHKKKFNVYMNWWGTVICGHLWCLRDT